MAEAMDIEIDHGDMDNVIEGQQKDIGVVARGRQVRIKNTKNDMYLTAVIDPERKSASVHQQALMTFPNGATDFTQVWHIFEIDNNERVIANKETGLVMQTCKEDLLKPVQLIDLQSCTLDNIRWTVGDDTISYRSTTGRSLYLTGACDPALPQTVNLVALMAEDSKSHTQKWIIDSNVEETPVTRIRRNDIKGFQDIPEINKIVGNHAPPSPSSVKVGSIFLPFLFVNQTDLSRETQSQCSPVYELSRHSYWKMVYHYNHPGNYTLHRVLKGILLGMISNNADEIKKVTGITVTRNGNLVLSEPAQSLINERFRSRLQTGSEKVDNATMYGRTLDYGIEPRSESIWFREDRYELHDARGKLMLKWVVRLEQSNENPKICRFSDLDV